MKTKHAEKIKAKEAIVSSLSNDIKEFESFLVFEYLGLDAQEIADLRKKFRSSGSKLVIHKNNTLNRAFKELGLKNSSKMAGPNAILLTKKDIKPFQDVIKLSKDKEFIKMKLAYFDNEIIENENLKLLASLGSKEDLLTKLLQTLMSPLYKLAFCLKNVPK